MKNIPFPTTVDLVLTGKCNLRCKHCNTADTWDIAGELSFNEIIRLLDELEKEKIFNLSLFGGEPFAYPRIYDFLKILNDYPMRVTILTNGTLIGKTSVGHLKKMRFLDSIQVSIDGSKPAIHDWQRGKGSFVKAIRAVKLLSRSGLPVSIKAIINNHNYRDIENMVLLAGKLGLRGMAFGDAVECGRASLFASDMRFSGVIHRSIMSEMFRLKRKYPGFGFNGTLCQKMEMLEDFFTNGPGKGTRGTFSTCPAGQNMFSIRSDGKVVPCSAFWTLICGDARKNSLRDIWENSKVFNEIRALAQEALPKYSPKCRRCDYLTYCNGGCRAAAYYSSGNDMKGIDISNCLVFSGTHGFRVPVDVVKPSKKGQTK